MPQLLPGRRRTPDSADGHARRGRRDERPGRAGSLGARPRRPARHTAGATRRWPTCRRPDGSGSWCTPSAGCCASPGGTARCCSCSTTCTGPIRPAWRSSRSCSRILPELPVGLLATYRSNWSHGWEGRSCYEQINLRALRPDDARRMAASSPGAHGCPRSIDRARARALGRQPALPGGAAPWRARGNRARHPHRLPATIHEMLLARLDALPPMRDATLQLASVVGMEFSERIVPPWRRPNGATDAALRTLQRRRARRSASGPAGGSGARLPTPAHSRGRVPQPAGQHPADAARPHRPMAGGARRRRAAAELARHYRDSDDVGKARDYLRLAGERAQMLNANREAHDWFMSAAATHRPRPGRQGGDARGRGSAVLPLGEIQAGRRSCSRRRLPCPSRPARPARRQRAALARPLPSGCWAIRRVRAPERPRHRRPRAAYGPSPELATAYSFRAQSLMLVPDFEGGELWARKAIEVAEADRCHRRPGPRLQQPRHRACCGAATASGIEYLRRSRDLAMEHHLTDDAGRANANWTGAGHAHLPVCLRRVEALLRQGVDFASRTIPDGVFDRWLRAGARRVPPRHRPLGGGRAGHLRHRSGCGGGLSRQRRAHPPRPAPGMAGPLRGGDGPRSGGGRGVEPHWRHPGRDAPVGGAGVCPGRGGGGCCRAGQHPARDRAARRAHGGDDQQLVPVRGDRHAVDHRGA